MKERVILLGAGGSEEIFSHVYIVGSFRKNGNTSRFVHMIEESMGDFAVQPGIALDFETL
jgi:hypothetical protein